MWSAPGERSKRKCEKLLITLSLGSGWTYAQRSLSFSLHLSKKCDGNKILFSPDEFTPFSNQQITILVHIFHSHAAQPVCSLFTLYMPSFAFTLVKTLTSFCTDGLMGVYQLSEGTSVSAGLYTCASSGCV